MKKAYWKLAVIALAAMLLCGALCGCDKEPVTEDTPTTESTATTTLPSTRITVPTYVRVDATGSVFIGTWSVEATGETPVTELTFKENGSVIVTMGEAAIGGGFVEEGDTVTLNVSVTAKKFTFVKEGDTITMNGEKDTWVLTKKA